MEDKTEDQVRLEASKTLGLNSKYPNVKSGSGQTTTFNKLGFRGISDKPDGWFLPSNTDEVAIILETKATNIELKDKQVAELKKNLDIVSNKYRRNVGILYNGIDVRVFKGFKEIESSGTLEPIDYYQSLFSVQSIDKQHIFDLTSKINNSLHFTFGIKDLYQRMIFTACALVAKRYGAFLRAGMDYSAFQNAIQSAISKALINDKKQNQKLDILLDVFSEIKMNLNINTEDEKEQDYIKDAISDFISWIEEISDAINSRVWHGEDVMAIFFNEFNRYKAKSENGQIFTPEHITDFMYKIAGVGKNDNVLDAAAGSGGFLVKAMANMIDDAGGNDTAKAKHIKSNQLFGIEFDRQLFALACANMLIHKDGKTNLEQLDSRTPEAGSWIYSKHITKVLMNPPYEHKYGPIAILENVLDNVENGTVCAFLLPNKKLDKEPKGRKLLKNNTLTKIIRLPENLFFGVGIKTSIFVFIAGEPQDDSEIFTCNIEEDGLETVKNKGRQDVNNKWPAIEKYWLSVIHKQTGNETIKWIKPSDPLSYPSEIPAFTMRFSDINKTILNYALYKNELDLKTLQNDIAENILFGSTLSNLEKKISTLSDKIPAAKIDTSKWKAFKLSSLFTISGSTTTPKGLLNLEIGGPYPYVTTAATNNGIAGFSETFTESGNVITVDSATNGIAFYQKLSFSASDHVEKLESDDLNEARAFFIVSVLNINAGRYGYGYDEKRSQQALAAESILLPVRADDSATPDWEYMEKIVVDSTYYSLI
ncbi:N-6 DNA methylase [Lacticaseibacillus paracasei]|uniref:N-6 DNA methylase n=1 Tax=Lacticaseibacillus paracasei TaxID=1597 RepID=UPI000F0B9141|nr:N-6 DNA methylase [Lacticaseibacillus paracasei]RND53508.1 Restriction enzyme BgcI subunit alpha [Lacticaseibacillus paracasei]